MKTLKDNVYIGKQEGVLYYNDVKDKILEFKTKIQIQKLDKNGSLIKGLCENNIKYVLKLHKQIFGDLDK